MLHYIEKIISIKGYRIRCPFNTAVVRSIDLKPIIDKYVACNDGLMDKLVDLAYFQTVSLDSYGTLIWANGVDFDPDNLYSISKSEAKLADTVILAD